MRKAGIMGPLTPSFSPRPARKLSNCLPVWKSSRLFQPSLESSAKQNITASSLSLCTFLNRLKCRVTAMRSSTPTAVMASLGSVTKIESAGAFRTANPSSWRNSHRNGAKPTTTMSRIRSLITPGNLLQIFCPTHCLVPIGVTRSGGDSLILTPQPTRRFSSPVRKRDCFSLAMLS